MFIFNLNAASFQIFKDGLTEGDVLYFDYQVAGHIHQDRHASGTQSPAYSLKRKLDTPEGSPNKSKRRAV
jgi:hypothetical protein